MSVEIEDIDNHFDPTEMDRFGLDVQNPQDREKWVTTEPITGDNPDLVRQLLSLYIENHPVKE